MKYNNYNIKSSEGVFFESSKQERTGFDIKHTSTTGKVSWHRESPVLEGTLKKIEIRPFQFKTGKVDYLRIHFLQEDGNMGVLSMPVLTIKGGVDGWLKAFAIYLPNLTVDQDIKMSLNRSNRDKKDYLYKNVYFRDGADDLLEWAFHPQEDVPKPISKPHPLTGQPVVDYSPVDKFYYDKVMEVVAAWKGVNAEPERRSRPANTAAPQATADDSFAGTPPPNSEDYDDLPF